MVCACGCGGDVVTKGANGLRRFAPGHAYEAKRSRAKAKTGRRGLKQGDLRMLRKGLMAVGGGRLAPGTVTLPGDVVSFALRLVDAELQRRRRKREERGASAMLRSSDPKRMIAPRVVDGARAGARVDRGATRG